MYQTEWKKARSIRGIRKEIDRLKQILINKYGNEVTKYWGGN